jgi:hypothetical protein
MTSVAEILYSHRHPASQMRSMGYATSEQFKPALQERDLRIQAKRTVERRRNADVRREVDNIMGMAEQNKVC